MAEAALLRQHFPSLAAFRSSEPLRAAARELLHRAVLLPVKRRVHNNYEMGARVEALLDFIVAACCIPHVFALLGEGSNKQHKEEQQAKTSYEAAQAMLQECLQFFKDAHQEYLAKAGDDEQLDGSRTQLVVCVINYRRVPWIASFARTVETHLPPLLGTMARHLLVVANLCGEVTRKIDAVTHAIRRKVSSQQEEEGTKQGPLEVLASHVNEFWAWLRQNRSRLVPLCRVTELVTSLDQTLRNSLKAEHYTSPEQFLDVFNSRYRPALNRLSVPLLEWTQSDHEQAMKDVTREHVIVNTRRVPGTELRDHLYDTMHPLVLGYLRALFAHYAASHGGNGAKKDGASDAPAASTTLPVWSEQQLEQEATELTWRVVDHMIVSSSRTVSCGDMLLLLEDLFGGEGLVLTPHGKDPVDVTIQVSENGEVVMEAAEQFHLVEADQQPLQGQQLNVLMTFRTNAITCLKLNRCPRCRTDLAVQAASHDENVETKADSAPSALDSSLTDGDGEVKADPDTANPASAPTTPSKAASTHNRILQQACSDVFGRLGALSQRQMCVLPLLPIIGQFVVGGGPARSDKSNSNSTTGDDDDDDDDDCYDV